MTFFYLICMTITFFSFDRYFVHNIFNQWFSVPRCNPKTPTAIKSETTAYLQRKKLNFCSKCVNALNWKLMFENVSASISNWNINRRVYRNPDALNDCSPGGAVKILWPCVEGWWFPGFRVITAPLVEEALLGAVDKEGAAIMLGLRIVSVCWFMLKLPEQPRLNQDAVLTPTSKPQSGIFFLPCYDAVAGIWNAEVLNTREVYIYWN